MTVAQTGDVGSTVVRSYTGASDTGHLVGTVPSGKVKELTTLIGITYVCTVCKCTSTLHLHGTHVRT